MCDSDQLLGIKMSVGHDLSLPRTTSLQKRDNIAQQIYNLGIQTAMQNVTFLAGPDKPAQKKAALFREKIIMPNTMPLHVRP